MPQKPASPIIIATVWMVGALFSFMSMAIGGRELSQALNTFRILFFRSVVGLIVITILLAIYGWHQVKTKKIGTHILRNIAHYGGQYGWFYGISIIPLAEVFALEFTLPIWVALLAPITLGEKFTKTRVTAIVLGFIGVLIILRPGIAVINPASFAVLGAALGYAISTLFTKKLSSTDSGLAIIFYMTLIQLPFGLIPSLADWVTPSLALWPWLIVVGVGALSAHYCMVRALALVDATIVAPLDFLRLPLIALVGFLFYSEPLNIFVFIGALLMVLGNSINIRAEKSSVPINANSSSATSS